MILDNNKEIYCKQCNKKEITYSMFLFSNLLYCFKCSMEKLKVTKINKNINWLTKNNNIL
jgi:late competence protein required for DNA uptake (superfamily II DNA/RNA helicase)